MNRREFLAKSSIAGGLLAFVPGELFAAQESDRSIKYVYDEDKKVWQVVVNGVALKRKDHIGAMVYTPAGETHISHFDTRSSELFAALFSPEELFDRRGRAIDPGIRALSTAQQRVIRQKAKGHAKRLKALGVKNIRVYYLPTRDTRQINAIKTLFRKLHKEYGIGVTAGHWLGLWAKPGQKLSAIKRT